jgi:hypothetical protein
MHLKDIFLFILCLTIKETPASTCTVTLCVVEVYAQLFEHSATNLYQLRNYTKLKSIKDGGN